MLEDEEEVARLEATDDDLIFFEVDTTLELLDGDLIFFEVDATLELLEATDDAVLFDFEEVEARLQLPEANVVLDCPTAAGLLLWAGPHHLGLLASSQRA